MSEMDMSEEKKPFRKRLLPEGWRAFDIDSCSSEVKSRSGNHQYIIGLLDIETSYVTDVYAVSEPKKRWFLKEILDACGIEKNSEGKYVWQGELKTNLLGKRIMGLVEHEDNTWIDREGNEKKQKQHKIVEVTSFETVKNEFQKAWDEQ